MSKIIHVSMKRDGEFAPESDLKVKGAVPCAALPQTAITTSGGRRGGPLNLAPKKKPAKTKAKMKAKASAKKKRK